MPPKPRSAAELRLLGAPTSVLNSKWLELIFAGPSSAVSSNDSSAEVLPFKLPPKLPTNEEVTKLYFFYPGVYKIPKNVISGP